METHFDSISLRDGEVTSAIDIVLLTDVLKKNGEEHLYETIMELSVHVEEAPLVIFGWQNVEAFVQAIEAARTEADAGGEPLPDDPLKLLVTVQNFKEALLEYARISEAPVRLDTTCLLCSLAQSMQVTAELRTLDLDPWIQRIIAVGVPNTLVGVPNALPVACVYVPRPRFNTLDRASRQYPNSLWG
ncbi:hypothetical protein PHMEG_00041525 [Phytophthora megakarya]|uniref:Uncharacterized protein n=1 Tax=Phytophthora megakarya TaxID=4795 RepID=A0A225UE32_9STRA|nr:hypothetical protein PHMEG_00041525 [Phytophthora megakarya]